MKKIIVLFSLVIFSSSSYATGWVGWNKITQIAFQNNDLMLYANVWENPNGCERADAVILKSSDQNFDKAYALILAAYMAGKEVISYSDGCHTFDGKTYNYIRGFKYLRVR